MSRIITNAGADALSEALAQVTRALERAAAEIVAGESVSVAFEAPRNTDFGDFATNVAFGLAKRARRAPQALATELVERMFAAEPALRGTLAEATPVAGFINIRFAPAVWRDVVGVILRAGEAYGSHVPIGTRVSLEFGSANPTGPLLVVQGRTLSLGDSLAKTMRFAGYDVTTEWIINDAGNQIETLATSLYARYRQIADPKFRFPEDGYPAEYLIEIAQRLRARDGARWDDVPEALWLPLFGAYGRDEIVHEQQEVCAKFEVAFDRWQSEKMLHESGAIERGIAALRERGLVFEQDGAVWMRATQFGDDKDRVIVRQDGRPTYYGADIAYHFDKLQRTDRAVLILGPDHHGYISRLEAIGDALGRPGAIKVVIAQQMTLLRDGEIVSLSKRAGNLLTLDEIIDEVGVDAARFFFTLTNPDSPMTFDLSLAKERSIDNPVYYVQYGHARIASIERRADPALLERAARGEALEQLGAPSELALARRLSEFPALVRSVAETYAPQRLTRYAQSVAADFHQFYMQCRVLGEDAELSVARLGLARATKLVLAQTLTLLGVSAPESMPDLPDEPS
jgi:arginyl-tRNA synthetase